MSNKGIFLLAIVILIIVFIGSLMIGSVSLNLFSLSQVEQNILWNVRFPRIVLGLITGIVLATVGAVFQGILNNPLADPYLLGVSSGAALGSIVAILLRQIFLMPILGFIGALITIILVWNLAYKNKFVSKTHLILAGIIISLFFSAIISLLLSLFHKELTQMVSVLLGNLGYIFSKENILWLWIISAVCLLGVIILNFFAMRINILATGDYSAKGLGMDVQKTRKILFLLASLISGVVVSFTGIIGFVGLIIPHTARLIIGANHERVIPLSGIIGGAFLIFCDTIARSLTVIEIPVGVITALFGAPFFIYLLKSR